eukprot:m.62923 g.62923  ORF g.62923 m.62923 type:complete len:629 (+) comp8047_c4_seq2:103-1989(+)
MAALERSLEMATRPDSSDIAVQTFCDALMQEQHGPKDAVNMLLDKIRSPNINVAIRSVEVLDTAIYRCDSVQTVVGKFRFLNEVIKMVSPKYHENRPQKVVLKVLEYLQKWAHTLQDEPKVNEVYMMLRKQGIVFPEADSSARSHQPPFHHTSSSSSSRSYNNTLSSPGPRDSPLERDKKKAKILEKLLKSTDPNDLMKANKLIKKMVEEDAKRAERIANLHIEMQTTQENIQLLSDLLSNFDVEHARVSDDEVIQQLLATFKETRPRLVKLAAEADEEVLGDVLSTNDDISRVLDQYSSILSRQPSVDQAMQSQEQQQEQQQQKQSQQSSGLDDLFGSGPIQQKREEDTFQADFGVPTQQPLDDFFGLGSPSPTTPTSATNGDDVDLLSGMLGNVSFSQQQLPQQQPSSLSLGPTLVDSTQSMVSPTTNTDTSLLDLDLLSPTSSSNNTPSVATNQQNSLVADTSFLANLSSPSTPSQQQQQQQPANTPAPALSSVDISLSSIIPSSASPVHAYDANGLKINIHLAQNSPHPSLSVFVVSFLNQNSSPLTNLNFQAAVPKTLQVKLQPPSSTSIGAFNVVSGPQTVTQVMIISNPTKAALRLRFKLHFEKDGQAIDDMKDVSQFPSI